MSNGKDGIRNFSKEEEDLSNLLLNIKLGINNNKDDIMMMIYFLLFLKLELKFEFEFDDSFLYIEYIELDIIILYIDANILFLFDNPVAWRKKKEVIEVYVGFVGAEQMYNTI